MAHLSSRTDAAGPEAVFAGDMRVMANPLITRLVPAVVVLVTGVGCAPPPAEPSGTRDRKSVV